MDQYRSGQGAASGEPTRAPRLSPTVTPAGEDLAVVLHDQPPELRAHIRGQLAKMGYRSLVRCHPDDLASVEAHLCRMIDQAQR